LIEALIGEDWSPEQISGWLKLEKNISVSHEWIYHHVLMEKQSGGYLYRNLRNGLKIAIVFNYSAFLFEIWLSAINRRKRKEMLEIISGSEWKKYDTVKNDENADAIIEYKIRGIDDFQNKSKIISLITKETIIFIDEIEKYI